MNERLQNVLYRYQRELDAWYENIAYHQQQFIIPYNPSWEDVREKPLDIQTLLHQILQIFVGYAGNGGTWGWHQSLDYGTGFSTGVICKQIDHPYLLGVDKDSIYLESPIAYPQGIHKMFDRFVHGISDCSRFGVFTYRENEVFSDSILRAHRVLLKKKIKGQLPELLRNYFVAKAELDADFDLGFLEVKWPLNQFSMYQFLTEGCRAFETLHHMNVQLWKKSRSSKAKKS